MQNIRFALEGMSCGACVRGVTNLLERMEGVEVRQVSVGSAEVSFDPERTSPSAISETLTEAGYPARPDQAA